MVGDHSLSSGAIDACVCEFILGSDRSSHSDHRSNGRFLSSSLEAALFDRFGCLTLISAVRIIWLSWAAFPVHLEFFDGALLVRIDQLVLHHGCHGRLEQRVVATFLSARSHFP